MLHTLQARFRVYGHVVPAFPANPVEAFDLAHIFTGGKVVATSDDHFGSSSNLLLPGRGQLTPEFRTSYGLSYRPQGKIWGMDGKPKGAIQKIIRTGSLSNCMFLLAYRPLIKCHLLFQGCSRILVNGSHRYHPFQRQLSREL
jgi:hypothetical protein